MGTQRINEDIQKWVVLIVDDKHDNVEVAAKVLSFNGAEVHTASNGQEGLDLIKSKSLHPTFILLDLSMPVMSGWEMLDRLRANPATAYVPVIALTAHAMEGDAEKVREAGFDGYIAKPFSIVTFMAEIRDVISKIASV